MDLKTNFHRVSFTTFFKFEGTKEILSFVIFHYEIFKMHGKRFSVFGRIYQVQYLILLRENRTSLTYPRKTNKENLFIGQHHARKFWFFPMLPNPLPVGLKGKQK